MSNEELTERWQGTLMNNYGTPRLPLVRGEGARLWDADGKEYLTSSAVSRSTRSGTPTRRWWTP